MRLRQIGLSFRVSRLFFPVCFFWKVKVYLWLILSFEYLNQRRLITILIALQEKNTDLPITIIISLVVQLF